MIDTPLKEADLKVIMDFIAKIAHRENMAKIDVGEAVVNFIRLYTFTSRLSEQELFDLYYLR